MDDQTKEQINKIAQHPASIPVAFVAGALVGYKFLSPRARTLSTGLAAGYLIGRFTNG